MSLGRSRLYSPKRISATPRIPVTQRSGAVVRIQSPTGIPTSDESSSCHATRRSTWRQLRQAITVLVVTITNATSGVAVLTPIVKAKSGIATRAVPKPNVEWTRVATKRIANVDKTSIGVVMPSYLLRTKAGF